MIKVTDSSRTTKVILLTNFLLFIKKKVTEIAHKLH